MPVSKLHPLTVQAVCVINQACRCKRMRLCPSCTHVHTHTHTHTQSVSQQNFSNYLIIFLHFFWIFFFFLSRVVWHKLTNVLLHHRVNQRHAQENKNYVVQNISSYQQGKEKSSDLSKKCFGRCGPVPAIVSWLAFNLCRLATCATRMLTSVTISTHQRLTEQWLINNPKLR